MSQEKKVKRSQKFWRLLKNLENFDRRILKYKKIKEAVII